MYSVHTKTKVDVLKFLRFEERFRKAPFSNGLVWTVGLAIEINLRFQIPPALLQLFLSAITRTFISRKIT